MNIYISMDYIEVDEDTRNYIRQHVAEIVRRKFNEDVNVVRPIGTIFVDSSRPLSEKTSRLIRVMTEMQEADAMVVPDDYYRYFTCKDDISLSEIYHIPLIKISANCLDKYTMENM
jgi:hypothetical protein